MQQLHSPAQTARLFSQSLPGQVSKFVVRHPVRRSDVTKRSSKRDLTEHAYNSKRAERACEAARMQPKSCDEPDLYLVRPLITFPAPC